MKCNTCFNRFEVTTVILFDSELWPLFSFTPPVIQDSLLRLNFDSASIHKMLRGMEAGL